MPTTIRQSYSYEYKNSNWKDKLTKFGNSDISYNDIGNLKNYNGFTYSWQSGKQLAGITGNSLNISYKYNDSGIRTEKNVKGLVTKYRVVDGKVIFESNETDFRYYIYDSSNSLVSMNLNGVE